MSESASSSQLHLQLQSSQSQTQSQLQPESTIIVTAKAAQSTDKENVIDTVNAMTLEDSDQEVPNGRDKVDGAGIVADKDALQQTKAQEAHAEDVEGPRPPLPPRPSLLQAAGRPSTSHSIDRPSILLSKPTTALSSVDIQTLSFPDGSRGTFSTSKSTASDSISNTTTDQNTPRISRSGSEIDDNASLMSYAPTLRANGDLASLLDEGLNAQSPAWKLLSSQAENVNPFESVEYQDESLIDFDKEFDELPALEPGNEEDVLLQWRSKLKHYLVLSSAGKPIYSRHGDQNLINSSTGTIQTIMSFYQGAKDPLMGFTAGGTRFVVLTAGPLYFMAISKLKESDAQLRAQLEALYMQILSTLTLPNLTHMFTSRPNTDLRRPLEGTESLLSSLADTFTKGSPSALLSALECLKIRKSERHVINNTLLKARSDKLLYGLIVAGGRLVSVARPKRHSLHPSDLQLIFNMLFEAGSIKAGGGENWIPLCLPGFNNRGYLYMYVSFLSALDDDESEGRPSTAHSTSREDEIAILLISADKESFYDLKNMRDEVVAQLQKNGSMKIIKTAVLKGRPSITDIAVGNPLRHFIYKSRANVQFVTPSYSPHFTGVLARRRLMTLYHTLHASIHAKHNSLKVLHCVDRDSVSLAWTTPLFEFYCIAGPNASRAALAQGANKIIQWVKREEQRIFIIGGAVF